MSRHFPNSIQLSTCVRTLQTPSRVSPGEKGRGRMECEEGKEDTAGELN